MNQLDIVILLIFFALTFYGAYKGLINQLFGLAAVIIAYIGTSYFASKIKSFVLVIFDEVWFLDLFVYSVLFVSIIIIVRLIGKWVTAATRYAALGAINRLLGGVLGSLNALVVLLAAYQCYNFILIRFESVRFAALSTSIVVPFLAEISRFILSIID